MGKVERRAWIPRKAQGTRSQMAKRSNFATSPTPAPIDTANVRTCWKLARVDKVYPSEDGLVRKVKFVVGTDIPDSRGKRVKPLVYLERPVHKLILLVPYDEQENREIPAREP